MIAREYGFASWPRLVEYFEEMDRHRDAPRYNSSDNGLDQFDAFARDLIRQHQRGDPIAARALAHYVPRFYARPTSEILATSIIEDEARLVVARYHRRASWEELVERASASRAWRERRIWEGESSPWRRAHRAMRAHDVDALAAILGEHPELLTPSVLDRERRSTLVSMAVTARSAAAHQRSF